MLPEGDDGLRAAMPFFATGDINHTVYNKTDAPVRPILFAILPADRNGPSLIAVKHTSG